MDAKAIIRLILGLALLGAVITIGTRIAGGVASKTGL